VSAFLCVVLSCIGRGLASIKKDVSSSRPIEDGMKGRIYRPTSLNVQKLQRPFK
jgi:hypothetical protein